MRIYENYFSFYGGNIYFAKFNKTLLREISNSFNSLVLLLRSVIDVLCVFDIVPSGANNSLE